MKDVGGCWTRDAHQGSNRWRDETWDRLARFFGSLFLINFAMGIVTGIVQEFQFGMNWSNYSVFVGNIFGAPLAMEGLLAFFLDLRGEPGHRCVRVLHPHRQRLDAAPGRLPHHRGYGGAHRLLGGPGGSAPVELGVLVFMALGVAGLLQGLPDAVSRLPVGRASLQRLAGLSRLPGPVVAHAEDGAATSAP
jgi:hypothetical protein